MTFDNSAYAIIGVTLLVYVLLGFAVSKWLSAWYPEAPPREHRAAMVFLFAIAVGFIGITASASAFLLVHR